MSYMLILLENGAPYRSAADVPMLFGSAATAVKYGERIKLRGDWKVIAADIEVTA